MTVEERGNIDTSACPARTRAVLTERRRDGAEFRWREGLPVSIREASLVLGVPYSTLAERVRSRGLEVVGRVGRARGYKPDDLVAAALEIGACH